jgi:hypothetical protein
MPGHIRALRTAAGIRVRVSFVDAVTSHEQRLNPSAGEMEYAALFICRSERSKRNKIRKKKQGLRRKGLCPK